MGIGHRQAACQFECRQVDEGSTVVGKRQEHPEGLMRLHIRPNDSLDLNFF